MNDVYARLAARMTAAAPDGRPLGGWLMADVLAAGQGTLSAVCNGLTLTQETLHVPPELDYTWTHDDGDEDLLRPGDRLVVLVSADQQDYYILQKARW